MANLIARPADVAVIRAQRAAAARASLDAEALANHACLYCGAEAGKPCISLSTGQEFNWMHDDRLDAARDARQAADGR